jgi:hypothetical protein
VVRNFDKMLILERDDSMGRKLTTEELVKCLDLVVETKKENSDELLELNWLESTNEWVINRGSVIITDNLYNESYAHRLLDLLQGECDE